MSDSEWLQQQKPTGNRQGGTISNTHSTTAFPTAKVARVIFITAILAVALYFYIDTQNRASVRRAAQQAAELATKQANAAAAEVRRQQNEANAAAVAAAAEVRRQQDEARWQAQEWERKAQERAAQNRVDIMALDSVTVRFFDMVKVAQATPRIALAQLIPPMQKIHREAQSIQVSACMIVGKNAITGAMSAIVDGFLVFMQNQNGSGEANSESYFKKAAGMASTYRSEKELCSKR